MKSRLMLLTTVCALAIAAQPQPSKAQVVSPVDTFKVVSTTIAPGDTGAIELFIVNDSVDLAAISAYFRIDNNVLEWVGVWDSLTSPPTFYVQFDTLPRAQIPGLFEQYAPLVMITNTNTAGITFGALVGAGSEASIPQGRGSIVRFYVRVKDDIPIGTQTQVSPFDPVDLPPHDDPRQCQYADASGLFTIYPTLVPGIVEVDTVEAPPGENNPPVINPLAQTSYTVQPPTTVNFSVSATDPDVPAQTITLSASGLPSGATFGSGGSVTGIGTVAGTFNWAPSISQVGTYLVTFSCTDGELSATPRSVSITVQSSTPVEEDLLFTSSSPRYGFPTGGIPGLSGVSIPVNLAELQDVYGVQFDFLFNPNVFVVDSIVPTDRLADFTVYDNLGVDPGRIRVVAFDLNNRKIQTGATSAIFDFWVTVKPSAAVGVTPIDFQHAWESISPNPDYPSVELRFDTTGLFIIDMLGDVNGDQRIDVADVVVVVGYIIGDHSLEHRNFHAADMDADASVDVSDLVDIINIIFGGASPSPGMYLGPVARIVLEGGGQQEYLDGRLQVSADLPTDIAGVQLEIAYDPEKISFSRPEQPAMAGTMSFRYRDNGEGRMTLLLYPGREGARIAAGSGVLFDLPLASGGAALEEDDVKITQIVLADPTATEIPVEGFNRTSLPRDFTLKQNYPNPFNPQTTIEFSIGLASAFEPVQLNVYNILGEKVRTLVNRPLAAGVHRVDWDGTNDAGQQAASGVYFYRLQVGDFSESKKMVLMK